uniref:glycosyltransferase family 2 protein n=1 Tax=Rosistilla oblonga TaxID=2527990 RepID=UPI003A96E063
TCLLKPVSSNLSPQTCLLKPVSSNLSPQTCRLKPVASNLSPQTCRLKPVASNLSPQTCRLKPVASHVPPPRINKLLSSFIIPTFNSQVTIERCLRSAVNSELNIEIIIADDGSSDSTVQLASQFNDTRITVIHASTNQGPSQRRNEAIERAKGDWIVILDSDDTVEPNRLERLLSLAIDHNLDVITDNQTLIRPDLGTRECRNKFDFGKDQLALLDLDTVIQNPGVGILQPVIRRQFLVENRLQYETSFRYGEDYKLLFDIVHAGGKAGFIDECLYNAYVSELGLTSNRVATYQGIIAVFQEIRSVLESENRGDLVKHINRSITNAKRTVSYGAVMDPLKSGQVGKALKGLIQHPDFLYQIPHRCFSQFRRRLLRTK